MRARMDEGVRRRRVSGAGGVGDTGSEEVKVEGGAGRSARLDLVCTRLVITLLALVLACLALPHLLPDHPLAVRLAGGLDTALHLAGLTAPLYAVVIDAGSTGSRVLAFSFYRSPTGSVVLQDELWHETKPGLSSFAGRAGDGADTVTGLLELAQARIPSASRATTPVTLKATAGLRLLPAEQSEALIAAVQGRLDDSGFDNRGVGIMSELDEGVFGWVTVNYLLDQLHNPRKSYAALDLGGGSTQVTFLPKYEESLDSAPQDFLHPVRVAGAEHTLYSHSYLGLGLMAARLAIFRLGGAGESLASPCLLQPASWQYHGTTYSLAPAEGGWAACLAAARTVVDQVGVDQPAELPTRKIAAFSYFHDRAVDAGLVGAGQSGTVTVQQFLASGEAECTAGRQQQQSSFACVDLAFISSLLHHGYRLAPEAILGLYKEIDGRQVSWGLGAAFNMLEQ